MARDRDIVDKYSGGGTGNWVGAPKKAEKKKAEKKATKKTEKKTAPKPRAKPARKTDTSERTREAIPSYKRKADLGGGPRKSTKKTNEKQSKADSGNAVLGQGRDSDAAKKMNRQPGYGIKGTQKKTETKTVTRGNIGRKSNKATTSAPQSKKNPRTMRGGRK